ncbi:TPA: GNAT family N-acetyltransferase [Enterococcus faecalis]|nr:GNAT family N-acetyltransferase [Enterococcus faecalis]
MEKSDVEKIEEMFLQQGWDSRKEVLLNYLIEQELAQRWMFIAEIKGEVAGYVTLIPLAKHGPYKDKYPEIVDFNVFEKFQRQGIGNELLNEAELASKMLSDIITLGVGLHKGYGAAQRIYIKRGYVPDGTGVWFNNENIDINKPCINNDDLVLYLSKKV